MVQHAKHKQTDTETDATGNTSSCKFVTDDEVVKAGLLH